MSTTLISLLGNEIIVGIVAAAPQRTFTGFTGADGITAMNHGLRGYAVPVTGTIRVNGNTYALARAAADTAINNIAAMQNWAPNTYTHKGSTYYNAIFHGFRILPQGAKTYHYTSASQMIVAFAINLIGLTN